MFQVSGYMFQEASDERSEARAKVANGVVTRRLHTSDTGIIRRKVD